MEISESVILKRGLVQASADSPLVTDADEEIFLLYTNLQTAKEGSSQGAGGLGFIDSHKDVLNIQIELTAPAAPPNPSAKARRGSKKARVTKMPDKTIDVVLAQDKTGLHSRSGDTGSVLWKASVDFAQVVLQQHHVGSLVGLFDASKLGDAHILELGAGTGLLSIVFSPLVKHYTVTDIAELVPLIRKNVLLNFTNPSNILVEELDWLKLAATTPVLRPRLTTFANPVDLLLVVDCIYHPSLLPGLIETISFLAVPEQTAVLVVVELRSEEVVRVFLELWIGLGNWDIRRIEGLLGVQYAIWLGWKQDN